MKAGLSSAILSEKPNVKVRTPGVCTAHQAGRVRHRVRHWGCLASGLEGMVLQLRPRA